jgi:hypothetical protein
MEVQKRLRGRNTCLYLVQSYREGGKVRTLERYLGRQVPSSLAPLKKQLGQDIVARKWGADATNVSPNSRTGTRATGASVSPFNITSSIGSTITAKSRSRGAVTSFPSEAETYGPKRRDRCGSYRGRDCRPRAVASSSLLFGGPNFGSLPKREGFLRPAIEQRGNGNLVYYKWRVGGDYHRRCWGKHRLHSERSERVLQFRGGRPSI